MRYKKGKKKEIWDIAEEESARMMCNRDIGKLVQWETLASWEIFTNGSLQVLLFHTYSHITDKDTA